MLAINRHEKILEWLDEFRSVKVSELSGKLGVTEKTVRDDLEKLEQRGLLRRIHGGAVPAGKGNAALLPLDGREAAQEEKRDIARKAVALIAERDIIALDGGSTTLEIARMLDNRALTVITHDLLIIAELTRKDRIRLVVPGGYRSRNLLIGAEGVDFVARLNIAKSFISATAVDVEYGLSVFTSGQIPMKQVLIRGATEAYAVADHTKFNKKALITFAELSQLTGVITDKRMDTATARQYEAAGVRIVQ